MLRRFTNGSGTTILTYPFGIEEHQYSGAGANQWNVYYYYLAGHLLGSLDSNGTQFYLSDAQGSLVSSFNNSQGGASMKSNQLFGPYGNTRYNAGSLNTAKGFIGQYNDGTGLDYFNARYYDPVVGVFLAADTAQGNAQGMNPYAYVNGNPETHSDPTGRMYVSMAGAGGGGSTFSQPVDPCTVRACTVTLNVGNQHRTYTISDLSNVSKRRDFLNQFYQEFAPGYGTAELAFFDYLNISQRLNKHGGYWDYADDQLAIDELLAAYDFLNQHGAQDTVVSQWVAFMTHPSNDSWWVAHNGSINAGDQQARASGLYAKESAVEQHFINETVNVINTIQSVSQGSSNPLNDVFSPKSSSTGTLASLFYPQEYTDASDIGAFAKQAGIVGVAGSAMGLIGVVVALYTWNAFLQSN